jgi:hypothetical protein
MPNGIPPDDSQIPDDEVLYRRITIRQVKRKGTRIERVGSNAFDDSSDGSDCSVHLESKLAECALKPDSVLKGYEDRCGLAMVTAGEVRELGFGVLYTPEPEWPAHGSLTGEKDHPGRQKRLAKLAKVVIDPPDTL